ncbi:MAG: pilus assembly protein [Geminicoccaceae bacterium]|nr:MAG: pilus assembly protein [Geminicoccaceae bacterium]
MTWSILVREPKSGLFGIAVASRFFAVGALVPHASPAGAVATQALVNPTYGPRGLRLLAEGVAPEMAVATLVGLDAGREHRQVHLLDRDGRSARWTGKACLAWCGHLAAENVSLAGNLLAGPAVLEATLETWLAREDLPLVARLLVAMRAGEAQGGDLRGKQSAAILVQGSEPWPRLSLRVDDHPEPLDELERLYRVAKESFLPFLGVFPKSERDPGIFDRSRIEAMAAEAVGEGEL